MVDTAEHSWKDDYRELVRELDEKERAWREAERLLRRAASQLAIAAMGQGESLDQCLEDVLETLRGEVEGELLNSALESLAETLKRLPRGVDATVADERIALLAGELVERIGKIPALEGAATDLTRLFDRAAADNNWGALVEGVAGTVAQVVSSIDAQRGELEAFLAQVTEQLDRFDAWTHWSRETEEQRLGEGRDFEGAVEREMRGIEADVDEHADLAELKLKVQVRLETVAHRLVEFRHNEAIRYADVERRNTELNQEVTKLRERTGELAAAVKDKENQLLFDALTHVHSRYAYEQRLNEEFHRWQRHGTPLSFVLWDIDRFKSINDTYGHSAGDRLLQIVARLLQESKREEDFVARIGGEEFVLLLPMTRRDDALRLADRIRDRIAGMPFNHRGQRERVTVSAGVAEFGDADTPLTVFQRADAALYEAKANGRNRCAAS